MNGGLLLNPCLYCGLNVRGRLRGAPAHAAVATTITAASKAITLLNRVAIAGYYTHAVTIKDVREGNPDLKLVGVMGGAY